MLPRRREDPCPPDVDLLVDDAAPRPALADPLLEVRLDALRRDRVGLRKGLASAHGAHQLVLELGQRRVALARQSRGGERERGGHDDDQLHARSASSMPSRSSDALTWPVTWPTRRPRRSTKNVSGRPVSPYGGEVTFWLSWTTG